MKLLTELFEYQKKAVEKLSRVKVGALYMEMGTGKTRTALELAQMRLEAGKVKQILWLCPFSVQKDLPELLSEHAEDFESQIRIAGIESLSNSLRIACELLDYATSNPTFLIVDESLLVKYILSKGYTMYDDHVFCHADYDAIYGLSVDSRWYEV